MFTLEFNDVPTSPVKIENSYWTVSTNQCISANSIRGDLNLDGFDLSYCPDYSLTWPDQEQKKISKDWAKNFKKGLDNSF